MIKKMFKLLKLINLKTIYFNLKYLPFKDAVKLPILISRNVLISEAKGKIEINAPIRPGMIHIGYGNVGIFDKKYSRTIWQVSGTVVFKGRASIGHGSKISVNKDAELVLGNDFIITAETELVSQKRIQFGNNVLISWDCLIMDTDFHPIYDDQGEYINPNKPIIVGNNVWIGCRNVILKGSNIADGSVIGTNSLLNRDISLESGIYAGNPIRLVKKNISWKY